MPDHRMSLRSVFESQPFLVTANVLGGIISIVIIGLTADNLAYVHSNRARTGSTMITFNITSNGAEVAQQSMIDFLPLDLRIGSYWLLLAAGIGGFLDAILLGGMLCWRRLKAAQMQAEGAVTTDRNLRPQTPLSIFIAVVAFLRPLAATIYSFTDWSRSGTFNPAAHFALTPGDQYLSDFFTPDAWNCQLEDYINTAGTSSRLENLCREGTAARTMTLGLTVLSAVVLYGVVWRTYRRH
ncbi:hypothetical protein EJ08DRAFT_262443 [Tothia fuscella]|uniref:Uncharacterized protein n=1 Tax=Tothia fuscella TaxID=1048955 RepID=A0A9P4NRC4_9PEZI|nr:hypothetical protein EJ08DRAFT_262443 [Tothia fuscella]